jgi:hypothetical protein
MSTTQPGDVIPDMCEFGMGGPQRSAMIDFEPGNLGLALALGNLALLVALLETALPAIEHVRCADSADRAAGAEAFEGWIRHRDFSPLRRRRARLGSRMCSGAAASSGASSTVTSSTALVAFSTNGGCTPGDAAVASTRAWMCVPSAAILMTVPGPQM